MSLEDSLGGHSASPVSSGRSTPVPKASRRAEEDGAHKGDKTFRKYAAIIERALSSWEISPEEWADYIAFLGRLLKAIQSRPNDIAILPHSTKVASKLSQCMNPALPSGVHQKALEVYAYIFSAFGRSFVSGHLDEFFPGISAVLSFASLSVRPALYDIFEEHIISLSPLDLRPVVKSVILSLLPALEEETSEDFERAFRLLESLEKKFSQGSEGSIGGDKTGFFWQCLFLGIITSPPRRQGALNFLMQKLPKFERDAEIAEANAGAADRSLAQAEDVVSPEPGLLIRAFVCGLSDSQLLIQRGFLDLLVSNLPLNSPLLQMRVRKDDLDRLVTAAMQVLLRREMSLNRRLWSWFLGPEPKGDGSESQPTSPVTGREDFYSKRANVQFEYFSAYGKTPLERSVLAMFRKDYSTTSDRARPFRLCLSLMDRWEIGGSVVPEMFLPAIKSAYAFSQEGSAGDVADLVRSASLFFDSIEATLIWANILDLVDNAFKQKDSEGVLGMQLARWTIQNFNIKDEEMITIHVPRCILFILVQVHTAQHKQMLPEMQLSALEMASTLLDAVPERALPSFPQGQTNGNKAATTPGSSATRDAILRAYRPSDPLTTSGSSLLKPESLTSTLHEVLISLTLQSLQRRQDAAFLHVSALLLQLHGKSPELRALRRSNFLSQVINSLSQRMHETKTIAFPVLASLITLITSLKATAVTESIVSEEDVVAQIESILTPQIWLYLSPSLTKFHVEATKALWQMHHLASQSHHLEATLAFLIKPSSSGAESNHDAMEAARRFGVLWDHSISTQATNAKQGPAGSMRRPSALPGADLKHASARSEILAEPLMLILDLLGDTQKSTHAVVQSWLHSLPTLDQVFRIHFDMLYDLQGSQVTSSGPSDEILKRVHKSNIRGLEYIVGHFHAMLKHGNSWVWECLADLPLQKRASERPSSALVSLIESCSSFICSEVYRSSKLEQDAIEIIGLALSSADSSSLRQLDLDTLLIDRLLEILAQEEPGSQSALLDLTTKTLKLRLTPERSEGIHDRPRSRASIGSKRSSTTGFRPSPTPSGSSLAPVPPAKLLLLLRTGFSTPAARSHIDQWLEFLSNVLPVFSDAIFSGLIPLVECICNELNKAHGELIAASQLGILPSAISPESAIMALLEALEMVLARAHRCLAEEQPAEPEPRPANQSRGLLGNVTSGVFKAEGHPSKTAQANSRLTVILTFQDAIRVSLRLWIWGSHSAEVENFDKDSSSTTAYNALRVRNRTRHLLEQIFAVEPLESLEVVVSKWSLEDDANRAAASLNLLHVLQGTRPKNVIPAILDALCSRTNPSALPPDRLSTQSTELTPLEVAVFLSAYLESTEDDAMDEIWPDCMAFLRDVLSNPLPYRQILPALLLTVLLLAQKLENTNFGEQRKMKKELGDSFNRLLTAVFTTMPAGYTQDPHGSEEQLPRGAKLTSAVISTSTSLISALKEVTANIEAIIETSDRATGAINSISSSLIGPMFRAKPFPNNVTPDALGLLLQLSRKAPLAKTWKKELLDAFNDPRLLTSKSEMMETHWFPVFYQWSLHDKERMPELLSRLTPPSSAGIMFGVGANAARLEADRRTQLNIRRISLLLLACPEDTFALHLRLCSEKLAELFDATASSSPSATVKAELFMLCRALVLSTSSVQLSPMWPIINDNLHAALTSLLPSTTGDAAFANLALLQACKLLDLLLTLSPDEFQLHEWLYVTDTIDAVYQPPNWDPSALGDQIAATMASDGIEEDEGLVPSTPIANAQSGRRRPLLDSNSLSNRDDFKAMAKEDFAHTALRPFLSQLSMYAYEATYGMDSPDVDACRKGLLEDLLDLSAVVE